MDILPRDVHPLIVRYLPQCHMLSKEYQRIAQPKRDQFKKTKDNLNHYVDLISLRGWGFVPTFNYWTSDCVVFIQTDRLTMKYIETLTNWETLYDEGCSDDVSYVEENEELENFDWI